MNAAGDNLLDTLCACAALRSAARSATQLYDLVLQPAGLKTTQFIALRCIDEAGEIAQWRLAREHAIAVETLSRRLAALRKRDLVTVRTGGNHGERIYALTPKGKEVVNRAIPYWERAQKRLRQTLGDPELRQLLQLCESTVEAARKAEQLRAANSSQVRAAAMPDGGFRAEELAPPA
jgi:DNA-binding MarR family transcriptional regulator